MNLVVDAKRNSYSVHTCTCMYVYFDCCEQTCLHVPPTQLASLLAIALEGVITCEFVSHDYPYM